MRVAAAVEFQFLRYLPSLRRSVVLPRPTSPAVSVEQSDPRKTFDA